MPTTIKEFIEWLQTNYEPDEVIAWSIWSSEDLETICEDDGIGLSKEEIERVLHLADRNQDAGVGINWDVLRFYIDEVISERKPKE